MSKLQRRLFQGNILPETDGDCRLGAPGQAFKSMYFAKPAVGTTTRANFAGLIFADDTAGDLYVGQEPENPGYYIQKATKADDASSVATNLFQGSWGTGATPLYPALEVQWNVGDGNIFTSYSPAGEDGASYIRRGVTTFGSYSSASGGGGGGLLVGVRVNAAAGTLLCHDESNKRFYIRTISGTAAKTATHITSIGLGGLRVVDVVPLTDNQIDLGSTSLNWKDLHLSGSAGFHGTAPPTQPSAYTQTYSTATRTHSNPTAATLTDSSGGTAGQTIGAVSGSGADTAINDNFASVTDEINKLIADVANVKQIANSLIDDGQTYGLLQ